MVTFAAFGCRDVRLDRRMRSRGLRFGFTLIELLIVISIMSILITIVMPSLFRARILAKRTKSAARVDQISQGLFMYKYDMNSFPGQEYMPVIMDWDANPPTPTKNFLTGAQIALIALSNMGYGVVGGAGVDKYDWNGKVMGIDGLEYGATSSTSPQYEGKYAEVGRSDIITDDNGVACVFWDRFADDNMPILYYPSRPSAKTMDITAVGDIAKANASVFSYFHNAKHTTAKSVHAGDPSNDATKYSLVNQAESQTLESFYWYVRNANAAMDGTTPYRVGEFLLMAPGIDRKFGVDADGKCDDLTNFPLN